MKGLKVISLLIAVVLPFCAVAQPAVEESADLDIAGIIFGHVGDSYEWHLFNAGKRSVALHLPVIVHSKTSGWHWLGNKEGLAQNYTGQVFNDFAQGSLDVDRFVQVMQQVCATAYAG